MGDLADPGAGPGWDDGADGVAATPAMPLALQDGASPTLGWQWRADKKGGPVFGLVTRTLSGSCKLREAFPLTEESWAWAWDVLARVHPDRGAGATAVLAGRAAAERARPEAAGETPELIALDVESLAPVRGVTLLGGYAPEADMVVGHQYDIRFREERLAIHEHRRPGLILELPYASIEAVGIGGPGLVTSRGILTGRRFAAIVALEGLAAAAVLSSLTIRTTIKTVIRVQSADAELFLLCTEQTPQDLRIYLSRPLAELRAARDAAARDAAASPPPGPAPAPPPGAAQVENLARLAAMLEADHLTRAEFDTLKASLLRAP
ncbi:MAG TPA: hypothetical protein VFX25_27720 [Streptosporangiaceae bacterium]|nr:hypothetical protein [Streptosporangiaceae bacterium]